MAVQLLERGQPSPLERLIDDHLANCRARGLSPRTDEQYSYAIRSKFLKWCEAEGITRLDELDGRTFDGSTRLSRAPGFGFVAVMVARAR